MSTRVPESTLRGSLGQSLFRAARLYNEAAIAKVQTREPRLRLAHTLLFPHLGGAGIRPTELARRLGISKQAVGPLVDDLVGWGMLERTADPHDGRATVVRLTEAGGAAILDGLSVLREVEAGLRADLGDAAIDTLHTTLLQVTDALEGAPRPDRTLAGR